VNGCPHCRRRRRSVVPLGPFATTIQQAPRSPGVYLPREAATEPLGIQPSPRNRHPTQGGISCSDSSVPSFSDLRSSRYATGSSGRDVLLLAFCDVGNGLRCSYSVPPVETGGQCVRPPAHHDAVEEEVALVHQARPRARAPRVPNPRR
jgi:hypothetical protein